MLLLVGPHAFVTRTQYDVCVDSFGVVYVGEFVPTGVEVLPLVPRYH